MEAYRICLEKYSHTLLASGRSNRWNARGNYVIYAAATRTLAYLENLVHRSGEGSNQLYQVTVINIPADLAIDTVPVGSLPSDWYKGSSYPACQAVGNAWYHSLSSPVLQVPSALVPQEFNYLLNATHPDFPQIRIAYRHPFKLDPRLPPL